ncbi:hypothetical protein D3C85_1449630 [compost metagenome]
MEALQIGLLLLQVGLCRRQLRRLGLAVELVIAGIQHRQHLAAPHALATVDALCHHLAGNAEGETAFLAGADLAAELLAGGSVAAAGGGVADRADFLDRFDLVLAGGQGQQ